MKQLHDFYKKLMGSDGKNAQKLEQKTVEADIIKMGMNKDVTRIKQKVDRLNINTYNKLSEISKELESVSYRIAIVTGAKRRGLK